jgi:hypothetical protein
LIGQFGHDRRIMDEDNDSSPGARVTQTRHVASEPGKRLGDAPWPLPQRPEPSDRCSRLAGSVGV